MRKLLNPASLDSMEEWRGYIDINWVVGGVLMNPCKSFGCILLGVLRLKLGVYRINKISIQYIYLYFKMKGSMSE